MDRRTRVTVLGGLAALVVLTLAVASAGPTWTTWRQVHRSLAPGSDPTYATWADVACPARDAELLGVMEPSVLRRGEPHRRFIFLVNLGPEAMAAEVHEWEDRWYIVEGDHLRLVQHGFAINDYPGGVNATLVPPLGSTWMYRDEFTTSATLQPGDYVRQLRSDVPRACGVSFFRVAP